MSLGMPETAMNKNEIAIALHLTEIFEEEQKMEMDHSKIASGKVREIYKAGEDRLLIVTTDRISAFDVIMPTPVPEKGKMLNLLSVFWFDFTKNIMPNHLISTKLSDFPEPFCRQTDLA